jgi:CubicO group peptidase (beta-lactamase class C family)
VSNNPVFAADNSGDSEMQVIIDSYVEENQATTAAMSVSVFDNSQVLFEYAYGYINIEEQIENDLDAVFEWGSAAKLFVYVSVLQLAEQGLLDLDTDIRTIIPEGFLTKLSYDTPITMIHLMNHTAGFQEQFVELFIPIGSNVRSLEESLRLLQPAQIFFPGTYSGYSNFGTTLAAYIVELVTGMPFHEYVKENIFTPLDMTNTALTPGLMDNPGVRERREKVQCYTSNLIPLGNQFLMVQWYPAGMATGTISDFRKFAQGLLVNEDGLIPLFQYPETKTRLHQATLYFSDGVTGRNYHGFLSEAWLEGHVIGHGGNTAGMSAQLAIDIENNRGAVIMTNQPGESIYCRQMLGEIFGRRDLTRFDNSENAGTIQGVFRSTRSFERGIFKIAGITAVMIVLEPEDGEETALEEVAPGVFFIYEPSFLLFATANEEGRVDSLSMIFNSFVRSSWSGVIFELAIIVLFVVAGFYSLIGLIKILLKKLRKKEQALTQVRGGIQIGALLAIINLIVMLLATIFMAINRVAVIVHGVIFIISAIIILLSFARLYPQIKESELVRKQKRQIIYTVIMGCFVILNLLYWQLWMFWV